MRKSFRKAVPVILALAAVLSGCGKGNEGSTASGTEASSVAGVTENSETESSSDEENSVEPASETSEENSAQDASEDTSSDTEAKTEAATVEKQEVVSEGMVPVYGEDLNDGTYDITVKSSSSMFNIEECTLTVQNGKMTAKMIMGGTGYLYVYQGTKEVAVEAQEADPGLCVPFTEEADGRHSFTIKVPALNTAVPCAAYSKKKEIWYDRDLCFEATALPASAYKKLPYETVESLQLLEGHYHIDVTLAGGSGRASVEQDAKIEIRGNSAMATIVWSSSKYDYMMVDGVRYDNLAAEGENSTFTIPVIGFDYPMPVQANTTAMSEDHLIDYTLTFDSNSIGK